MRGKYYTNEQNILLFIALLKEHGVRKIIASPGTKDIPFVASVAQDPFFEVYSCVDERSACYMACGMAAESGEPVVITCTGATASRNYVSGLTEAFYRKLPVLAATFMQHNMFIGHNISQVIDRRQQLNDMVSLSEQIDIIRDSLDEWSANVKINNALLALRHKPSGPVHLNITTLNSRDFSVRELPKVRVIKRVEVFDEMPEIPRGKVGIFVGAHLPMKEELTNAIDMFCECHNAVVFVDQTSGYKGKYRVPFGLVMSQEQDQTDLSSMNLLIHLGEITGDYPAYEFRPNNVWRVSEDGMLRDTYRKLQYVFEMKEQSFFESYINNAVKSNTMTFYDDCMASLATTREKMPELPLSNIWIASQTAPCLPKDSVLHLAILNSLRAWNLFDIDKSIDCFANTGGFGIDGGMSAAIGGALACPEKIHFLAIGDLAFFYDLNSIGNKHLPSNLRILLVNNGKGAEFRLFKNIGSIFGDEADDFLAAGGHFGNKSSTLVKHFAEDLGFIYMQASTKEEYLSLVSLFTSPKINEKPMLLEVFTNSEDEDKALKLVSNINVSIKGFVKETVKKILPTEVKDAIIRKLS